MTHDGGARVADLLARLGDGDSKELFRRLLKQGMQDLIDARPGPPHGRLVTSSGRWAVSPGCRNRLCHGSVPGLTKKSACSATATSSTSPRRTSTWTRPTSRPGINHRIISRAAVVATGVTANSRQRSPRRRCLRLRVTRIQSPLASSFDALRRLGFESIRVGLAAGSCSDLATPPCGAKRIRHRGAHKRKPHEQCRQKRHRKHDRVLPTGLSVDEQQRPVRNH